jgi:transposase-like protein
MKMHRREFWAKLVNEVEAGGTLPEVARRHQVKVSTLRRWRTRLSSEMSSEPRLVPVMVRGGYASAQSIEVTVRDCVLRFEVGTDVEYVSRLLRAIESSC